LKAEINSEAIRFSDGFFYFLNMKLISLLSFLVITFSVFAQNKLDQNTSEQLNTRISAGGKASKVLLDSLYSTYKNTPFMIYEDSNSYESCSTYLYNSYKRLKAQFPKICKDCDKKMQVLRNLTEVEKIVEIDAKLRSIQQLEQ
jgi:hypothetical protein